LSSTLHHYLWIFWLQINTTLKTSSQSLLGIGFFVFLSLARRKKKKPQPQVMFATTWQRFLFLSCLTTQGCLLFLSLSLLIVHSLKLLFKQPESMKHPEWTRKTCSNVHYDITNRLALSNQISNYYWSVFANTLAFITNNLPIYHLVWILTPDLSIFRPKTVARFLVSILFCPECSWTSNKKRLREEDDRCLWIKKNWIEHLLCIIKMHYHHLTPLSVFYFFIIKNTGK